MIALAALWGKAKTYLAIAAGAIGAGALAVLYIMLRMARDRAKDAEAEARQAKQAEAIHEANEQHASEVQYATTETQHEIAQMPDAGTQQVGAAQPGTAAGWLREHADRGGPEAGD